jgi:hypothetical protein
MQLQQTEIAIATTSPAEHDWYRGTVRRLARLDAAWLAVLLCYCAVFGGILIYSDFLPYTFDNNESFSAFWHARNMYEYGIANSSGLADESFSYDRAAHPYVYTHAGASPRLFAYVLYVLGIRTIELQIAVTVFTIGLLSFWFAYRFLADISTRLYATIACLLLMTDYIMFVQWHIGAWHVWKMFLLFGGLYLAQRVAARKQAYPLLVVYAFHAFLFYYETIFNVYVAAAVFLYFVFAGHDYRFAVKFGLAQFAGALTAAAILLGQLMLQFGWDVVRADIYYTFIGRNFATDATTFLEAARKFYDDHNIVFWLNVPESSFYRNLPWAIRFLFQDHAVHTPPWTLVVLAFAAAEIVRRLRAAQAPWSRFSTATKFATAPAAFVFGTLSAGLIYVLARHPEIGAGLSALSPVSISALWPIVLGIAVIALVAVTWPSLRALQARTLPILSKVLARFEWKHLLKRDAVFVLIFFVTLIAGVFHYFSRHPELAAGLASVLPVAIGVGLLVAAAVSLTETMKHFMERLGFAALFTRPGRMLGMSMFIAAALAFLLVQPDIYAAAGALEPIWRAALLVFTEYTTGAALFIALMLLFAAWHACGTFARNKEHRLSRGLFVCFAALLLAYILVFFVFTGYVFTGYFARYLSLTVYFNDLLLALGILAMIDCVRGWYGAFKQSIRWNRVGGGTGAAVAAVGLAGVVVYWASLQTLLLRKLPPSEISFFPILSTDPFRGSTFAASIYGGTTAYFNKNWAYFDADSALADGGVTLGPEGYRVNRDDAYVWFADRSVNPAYEKPEYFLAMTFLYHGLMHGRGPGYLMDDENAPRPRAGDLPLVRAIREGRTSYLHPVEVARDPSPLDRWSIIRLDWDYPPFLRVLEGGEFVTLDTSPTDDGVRIRVDYRYAQQESVPEAGTRIALFARSRCAGSPPDVFTPVSPSADTPREFNLPRSFVGEVRAEVQPATATKTGPIYGSPSLEIGSADACHGPSAARK